MSQDSPRASASRHKKRRISDDDDETAAVSSTSMQGDRRAGRRAGADSRPSGAMLEDEDANLSDDEEEDVPVDTGIRPEYERDTDDFVKGSIVRVKLINFMTYDHLEFHPGPRMNMILGPNGSGKSSIAGALAIGLGFKPGIMGRDTNLKSYVRQGTEVAEIEIEIKGGIGQANTILHCRFTRDDEKQVWKINGAPARRKDVSKAVREFGVQADNLCSFLPQEKVASFATMTPDEVLSETMRAAGDPRLTAWHGELCERGKKAHQMNEALKKDISEQNQIGQRLDRISGEVQAYRRRAELFDKQTAYDCLLKMMTFEEKNHSVKESELLYKSLVERRETLQASFKPVEKLLARQRQREADATAEQDRVQVQAKGARQGSSQRQRKIRDIEDNVQDIQDEIDQDMTRLERARKARAADNVKLAAAQAIVDRPLPTIGEEDLRLKNQMRDVKLEVHRLSSEHKVIDDRRRQEDTQIADLNNRLKRLAHEQTALTDAVKRREKDARDWDPSIGFILDFLDEHEARLFERPVIRPACITVNMADPRYANQIEACTSFAQRKTFLCQTPNDFAVLSNLRTERLPQNYFSERVNQRSYGAFVMPYVSQLAVEDSSLNPPTPCSREQLKTFGFDGFAIDFVSGPDLMICFLNQSCGFSRIPVTLSDGNNIATDAVGAAGILTWVTSSEKVQGVRSAYGRRDLQTSSGPVSRARSFGNTIDNQAVEANIRETANCKRQQEAMEGQVRRSRNEYNEKKEQIQAKHDEHASIKAEIEELRRPLVLYTQAKNDIATLQSSIADHDDRISKLRKKVVDDRGNMKTNIMSRVPAVKKLSDQIQSVQDVSAALSVGVLRVLLASENKTHVEHFYRDNHKGYKESAARIERQKGHLRQAQEEKKAAEEAAEDAVRKMEHGAAEIVNEILPQNGGSHVLWNRQALVDLLDEVVDELSQNADVGPDVLLRFQRLDKDKQDIDKAVEKASKEVNSHQKAIADTRRQFDPALDALVETVNKHFSKSFANLGCTGEVRINRTADYANWGIEIAVSYRDGDELALLGPNRQSGGERALATITYLMSLTEMSRTPFSLVDEINQGMDQRAERNMHNQLVRVTNQAKAGQYFLITPKLLLHLDYHPGMKIINVINGQYVPPPGKRGNTSPFDLKACARAVKRRRMGNPVRVA